MTPHGPLELEPDCLRIDGGRPVTESVQMFDQGQCKVESPKCLNTTWSTGSKFLGLHSDKLSEDVNPVEVTVSVY